MENQQVINAAAERQANCLLDENYHPNSLFAKFNSATRAGIQEAV